VIEKIVRGFKNVSEFKKMFVREENVRPIDFFFCMIEKIVHEFKKEVDTVIKE
jgi:hypothetical protein